MVGDAAQHIDKPNLRIDSVEFRRGDQPSPRPDDCEGSTRVVWEGSRDVGNWQCALKARIISGGGFHPDNCR
jgi:hypothetical protein